MQVKILYFITISLLFQINLFAYEKIIIAGTGSSHKILSVLAKEFEKKNPNIKIILPASIGSGGGIRSTALGKSDLGRVARELKKSEKKYKLNYLLFAYSPVVFVTNNNVKHITNITEEQLVDIYTGKITNWKELGANSGKIFVASREAGDSVKIIIDANMKKFSAIENPTGKILFSVPEMLEVMTKYKNTIGYLPYSQTFGTTLNILKINGIKPTNENIQHELYKIYGPLAIVYRNNINDVSKKFLNFLKTPQAKKIINAQGAFAQ